MSGALSKVSRAGLAKYDPRKGVGKIRFLEVAKKHYAKARDAKNLEQAIRLKWDAQAEFIFWWDTQAQKDKGARQPGSRRGREKSTTSDRLSDFGLDKFLVHQWRRVCASPERFEEAVAADFQHSLARVERERREKRVSQNSGEFEWYTPAEYLAAAREAFGGPIDLDPASTDVANRVIQAEQIFTKHDDALQQAWHAERLWMNPPYSQPLVTHFCKKLAASVEAGTVKAAVVLVNNATETEWFRTLADLATAICFPTGRVKFWSPKKETATPLQGQAVLYIGNQIDRFCAAFESFGFLTTVRR